MIANCQINSIYCELVVWIIYVHVYLFDPMLKIEQILSSLRAVAFKYIVMFSCQQICVAANCQFVLDIRQLSFRSCCKHHLDTSTNQNTLKTLFANLCDIPVAHTTYDYGDYISLQIADSDKVSFSVHGMINIYRPISAIRYIGFSCCKHIYMLSGY